MKLKSPLLLTTSLVGWMVSPQAFSQGDVTVDRTAPSYAPFMLNSNGDSTVNRWEDLPPIRCGGDSTPLEFSISSQGAAGPLSDHLSDDDRRTLARTLKLNTPRFTDTDNENNVMIQGCLQRELFSIQRVVTKRSIDSFFEVFTHATADFFGFDHFYQHSKGFTSGVLDARVVRRSQNKSGFLLNSLEQSGYLFIAFGNFDRIDFRPTWIGVLLGNQIAATNPFKANPCSRGTPAFSQFSIDQAHFEISYCRFSAPGHTTGYDITEVSITDHHPEVPSTWKNQKLTLSAPELSRTLTYRWNHHNGCDSFVLSVPQWQGVYAMTAPTNAGCGSVIPGAPPRSDADRDAETLYSVSYKGQAGPIRKLEQPGHYLFLR